MRKVIEKLGILGVLGLFVAGIVGWVLNITTISHATEFSGMLLLRLVGVPFPLLGAILGYVS
jgi:hypothetical protein